MKGFVDGEVWVVGEEKGRESEPLEAKKSREKKLAGGRVARRRLVPNFREGQKFSGGSSREWPTRSSATVVLPCPVSFAEARSQRTQQRYERRCS